MRRFQIIVLAAALLAPASAQAATVHIRNDPDSLGFTEVVYEAGPGEANRTRLVYTSGTATTPYTVTVRDPGAVIDAGAGCTPNGPHEASCAEVGLAYISNVELHLRDRDDTLGTGYRTLYAGTEVDAHGGSGSDRLRGSRTTDMLDGGRGRDVIDGGPGGADTVNYSSRTRRVTVDLARGRGGQRGENDVLRNVEYVDGGRAGDRIAGGSGHNHLVGNGGRDLLLGRGGGDWIEGKRGRDRLVGGGASDELYPGSGLDSLSCGTGSEDVVNHPIPGERMSRHCDVADYSDDDGNSFRIRPNAIAISRKKVKFAIGCPYFSQDDGEFRDCGGGIVVRARHGGRVLGRGFVGPFRSERSTKPTVVRLTKLGRRLTARPGGVDVDVSLHDDMPHVAWTVGLAR